MKEVQEFLKSCGVYFLATMDGDQPRVRPFGTAEIFENHLYIETGKKKDVFKQIEKNNKVEICAFKDSKWIRVSGELVVDQNPYLRRMYDENDDNTVVLYFKSAKAIISSFTEEPKIIEF